MSEPEPIERGVSIRVEWEDEGSLELLVTAAHERFVGRIRIYSWGEQVAEAARSLAGFPASVEDARELEFGTTRPEYANGCVRCVFRCSGGSGRAFVVVTLLSREKVEGIQENATIVMPVEASAVDTFVRELESIATSRVGIARLLAP
jgi:hypothetical protein